MNLVFSPPGHNHMEKVEIIYNLHVLIMMFMKLYDSRALGQHLETGSWRQTGHSLSQGVNGSRML